MAWQHGTSGRVGAVRRRETAGSKQMSGRRKLLHDALPTLPADHVLTAAGRCPPKPDTRRSMPSQAGTATGRCPAKPSQPPHWRCAGVRVPGVRCSGVSVHKPWGATENRTRFPTLGSHHLLRCLPQLLRLGVVQSAFARVSVQQLFDNKCLRDA